jgi:hypothetical protein
LFGWVFVVSHSIACPDRQSAFAIRHGFLTSGVCDCFGW